MTLDSCLRMTAMTLADLDVVVTAEATLHASPWTRGQFAGSLAAGHEAVLAHDGAGRLVGYGVVMLASGDADLLNISVLAAFQRQGHGAALLRQLMGQAKAQQATRMLLEVRPSNAPAQALYRSFGFAPIGRRKDYYPGPADQGGREDAIVMAGDL